MSILIKELHLPTEHLYPLHLTIYSDGSVFCGHGIGKRSYEAVEVPVPHGRLVDLDKIENEIAQLSPEDYTTGGIRLILDYAPTIIPAEEDSP